MPRSQSDLPTAEREPLSPLATSVAAAAGVAIIFLSSPDRSAIPYIALAAGLVVSLFRRTRDAVATALNRLRTPSPKVRGLIFAAAVTISGRYFMLSASLAGREFHPGVHDEFMNLLQARMLAHGRLWMPQHPLADFFDSFNILVRPVYGSMYFPGTALFYVPADWIGAAPWVTSVLISASAVGVSYLVMTELVDGVAGLLAALMLVSLHQVRTLAISAMSQPVMLLLVLLAMWSYLRWRREESRWRLGHAAAFGAFAGWAAITRPLDAICLIGPIGLAFVWDLRRQPRGRGALCLAIGAIAAAPFLALQLSFDRAVTGHWLQTPVTLYDRENFPGLTLGFRPRQIPSTSPSSLPQLRVHYDQFFRKPLEEHGRRGFIHTWIVERLLPAADVALPAHLLFGLIPLTFIAIRGWASPSRVALVLGAVSLPLAYSLFPIYLGQYGLVLAPAFVLLILLAGRSLSDGARGRAREVAFTVAIAVLCIAYLPEVRRRPDPYLHTPFLNDINLKLAMLEHKPAVVLFRYTGHTDVLEEPVYNIDVAWPDDAEIIRAQDRGEENQKLFDYYAARQPNRFIYVFDRAKAELTPLGWATSLASRLH